MLNRMYMKLLIDEIIQSKGLKKSYVAQQMGVSPTTLSRWINGHRRMSLEDAVKLADVLGVKLEDLVE